MIDLNGDGTEEAICFPAKSVYSDDDPYNPCGATGNCPGYIFQKLGGKWYPIADLSGSMHHIEEQSINGWPVVTSTWKMGGQQHEVKVHVYENGRYRVLHTYTFVPWEIR